MNKMCIALLLALHLLSSQVVQAQNSTDSPMNGTMTMTNSTMMTNTTGNMNVTDGPGNGCARTDALTLLFPLALAGSLLHGSWS